MNQELIFYTNPRSCRRIVRWMLEEVGRPYQSAVLEYATVFSEAASDRQIVAG